MIYISDESKEYIHYGSTTFDQTCWLEPTNDWVKPRGGLWASPIDAEFGWKDWNEWEKFSECNDECSFKFTIKFGYRVLYLESAEDFLTLDPKYISSGDVKSLFDDTSFKLVWIHLDFERLKSDGICAVEIKHNRVTNKAFHCWDCDSIVVLDKDAINVQ